MRRPSYDLSTNTKCIEALQRLVAKGWIHLADFSILLGYKTPVSLYKRQRNPRKAIPAVKVGCRYRVTEEVVLQELEKDNSEPYIQVVLELYNTIKRQSQSQSQNPDDGEGDEYS